MSLSETSYRDLVIPNQDGHRLHARLWTVEQPRGVVVIAHGFGEHGGWYDHVARAIGPACDLNFVAPDLRGHGLSEGKRGVVKRFDELTGDLIAAFDWAGHEYQGLPRWVLGHSNGGQVALRAAFDPKAGPQFAGLILSNPSIRVAVHIPEYTLRLAKLLLWFAPGVTLKAPMDVAKLTRDPAMQQRRRDDPLGHNRISAPLFFGMVEGGSMITRRAGEIHMPLLLILGGADPIIDPLWSREVFDRFGSEDKTLLLYPNMLHEPFNEVGREKVLSDVIGWVNVHIGLRDVG